MRLTFCRGAADKPWCSLKCHPQGVSPGDDIIAGVKTNFNSCLHINKSLPINSVPFSALKQTFAEA